MPCGKRRQERKHRERQYIKGYKNYVAIDPRMTNDKDRLERIERYKELAKEGKPLFTKNIAPTTERAT